MKDIYKDVDDFIIDVMPVEHRNILHKKTKPEEIGSDSATYKFEEKLEKILAEKDEDKTNSTGEKQ